MSEFLNEPNPTNSLTFVSFLNINNLIECFYGKFCESSFYHHN